MSTTYTADDVRAMMISFFEELCTEHTPIDVALDNVIIHTSPERYLYPHDTDKEDTTGGFSI